MQSINRIRESVVRFARKVASVVRRFWARITPPSLQVTIPLPRGRRLSFPLIPASVVGSVVLAQFLSGLAHCWFWIDTAMFGTIYLAMVPTLVALALLVVFATNTVLYAFLHDTQKGA
jgi:hypothetical protein